MEFLSAQSNVAFTTFKTPTNSTNSLSVLNVQRCKSDGRATGDSDYEILVRRFPENKRENTLKTLEHGRKLIRIHSKAVKLSDINIHMPS